MKLLRFPVSAIVMLALMLAQTTAAQSVFQERHSSVTGVTLRGLAASDDILIAVGDGGRILRSADGVTWSAAAQAGSSEDLRAVAYFEGKFIAVGTHGRIAVSADGRAWTAVESGTGANLNGVTFGGGKFVAVGDSGTILSSTDGITWAVQTSGVTTSLRGVGWMSQSAAFVAVGDRGTVLDSGDGSTWSPRATDTNDDLLAITAGHVFFYAAGRDGVYSGTASLFVRENGTGGGVFRSVAMQPGSGPIALAVGDAGAAAVNRGDPWRQIVSGTTWNLMAAILARGTFFAVGEREAVLQGLPETAQRAGNTSELIRNLSNRAEAGDGSSTLTSGFVITGSGTKRLLVRAAGPALANFGVDQVLMLPTLTVFNAEGHVIGRNAGWHANGNTEQIRAMTRVTGAFRFPESSADSALLLSLAPGAYTAQISGPTRGIGLVEIYDTEYWPEISSSRLINISSRCLVGDGEANAITGIALPGGRRLLIRAVGPGLASFGVDGVMSDPLLQLIIPATGPGPGIGSRPGFPARTMAENNDWNSETRFLINPGSIMASDEVRNAAIDVGAFPLNENSKDAAMLVTLNNGGNFTINVIGADGRGGVVLVEVYDLGDQR